ncbi:hypothetical protein EN852_022085 [Mesorhizobium sp. M2E.F.Ca.ET.209.01.1.1]|uniref:hypothetical protein n=1 Tax=Mesorhizobium sp. M2E.F.Ca.ET.209.01.1.1 TaxID=2500526 RepID=UPI000FD7024B|nr:hypothetical protein [Mesorhizobium sp. M2E.F.Ca.ET.209.01.1.1]TGS11584.1 hypothetical protein EN852_022085 [Mesorhizobium sp. M2E.F.Ca.ET.209.01.1.1]
MEPRYDVFFDEKVQLGDTPSATFFPDAQYAGLELHLPIRPSRNETDTGDVQLRLETSLIETWEDWQKHTVNINGQLVGYIGDPNDRQGGSETFILTIGKQTFDAIAGGYHTLSIICGSAKPGLIDDFELKKIAVAGANIKLGWG